MFKRVLILVVAFCMLDSAFGRRHGKKGRNGEYVRGPGGKWIRVGSDKDYLWNHDLSDSSITERKELEFHVSDGNSKVITSDGTFSQNGEILARDGVWLNKKKFAVYVPKWKGWWVGKVVFNKQDNVRGMKTMFIKSDSKTTTPPKQVRKQKPQRLEKGDLLFKTLVKSTDIVDNDNDNDNGDDSTCDTPDDTSGNHNNKKRGKNRKHHKNKHNKKHKKKHKKHGKKNKGFWHWHGHDDQVEYGDEDDYYYDHDHHHGHHHHGHHHHHGCHGCGIFGRILFAGTFLLLIGILLVITFRAALDDVCSDCCLLSLLKIKLDLENREFRITWKNKKDTDSKDKDKDKNKKRKGKDKNKENDENNDQAQMETSKNPDGGEE